MQVEISDKLKTHFLTGKVVEIIDGSEKAGWKSLPYYRVEVVRPSYASGTVQIIRLDEIIEVDKGWQRKNGKS